MSTAILNNVYSFSAEIDCRRQNLTYADVKLTFTVDYRAVRTKYTQICIKENILCISGIPQWTNDVASMLYRLLIQLGYTIALLQRQNDQGNVITTF